MNGQAVAIHGDLRHRNTVSLGIMIGIASWALVFVTLIWGYVVYRLNAEIWLEDYLTPSFRTLTMLNTFVLIVSSGVYRLPGKRWAALLLGALFLLGQLQLWRILMTAGLDLRSNIAGSFLYLLTGFHGLHIAGGLIAILVVCLRSSQSGHSLLEKGVQYFWDMLLVVWIIMMGLIFILH